MTIPLQSQSDWMTSEAGCLLSFFPSIVQSSSREAGRADIEFCAVSTAGYCPVLYIVLLIFGRQDRFRHEQFDFVPVSNIQT